MTKVQNQTSDQQTIVDEVVDKVYFSNNIGISVSIDDEIAKGDFLKDELTKAKELGDKGDSISINGTHINFTVDASSFAYFMHMLYCSIPEGYKLVVEFDGLYPFEAEDEYGVQDKFNGQLVTISQVRESV